MLRSSLHLPLLGLLILAPVAACGDDDGGGGDTDAGPTTDGGGTDAGPQGIIADRPECENVNPHHCLLPWPSSHFLAEDGSTVTGRKVALEIDMMPENQLDEPVTSVHAWNRFDGFSPMTSMMTLFPGELDTSNLVDERSIPDSLEDSSPTVILDAETGERVPHWAELDRWPDTPTDRASFYIRPAVRRKESHRYIVAIRDLSLVDGTPVEPSEYFRALRDGEDTDVDSLEARRAHFEDIFTELEAAGVERGNLIEAWDFHTASGQSLWGDAVRLRDDAYERVGEDGIGCTVESVEMDVNAETWKRVRGTFTVPLYMEDEFEGAAANRDASGQIVFNRMAEAPFEVDIPYSVRDRVMGGGTGARMVMYGHGLLGAENQVGSGGTRVAWQRNEMVGFGTAYWGLSEPDEGYFVNEVVTNWGNVHIMMERLLQGTVNSLVLARSFKGVCSELEELQIDVGGTPTSLVDPTQVYYYGISQGGIMGATIAGLSTDIEKYVLQVGAISYSMLMRRSLDFDQFEDIYKLWYPDPVDRHILIASIQAAWDLTEPSTYVPHLVSDPLPDTPVKQILYQTSLYDTEVHNSMSDIAVRSMGIPYLASSVYDPWNVEEVAGPADSAYVIYHLHDVEPIPYGSEPPEADNNAHGDLRYTEPMLEQMDRFLMPDGQVEDTCPDASCELTNPRAD